MKVSAGRAKAAGAIAARKSYNIEAANDGVQDLEDKHVHDAGDESHCNDDQDHNATDVEKGDASSDVVDEADSNATSMEEDEMEGKMMDEKPQIKMMCRVDERAQTRMMCVVTPRKVHHLQVPALA